MNTEDKQKAMLADDLSVYVKDKHTQEECIGFIDGYNAALNKLKLLGIADVSQQRELFVAFLEWYLEDRIDVDITMIENDVKKYIATNCG